MLALATAVIWASHHVDEIGGIKVPTSIVAGIRPGEGLAMIVAFFATAIVMQAIQVKRAAVASLLTTASANPPTEIVAVETRIPTEALPASSVPPPTLSPPVARLVQKGSADIPDISHFTLEILADIDAILADSPFSHRDWFLTDKLGDHSSNSLPAVLNDVVWGTVSGVLLMAGVIPGGPFTSTQASLTLSAGARRIDYQWTDPTLRPALERTVYRIQQCFEGA